MITRTARSGPFGLLNADGPVRVILIEDRHGDKHSPPWSHGDWCRCHGWAGDWGPVLWARSRTRLVQSRGQAPQNADIHEAVVHDDGVGVLADTNCRLMAEVAANTTQLCRTLPYKIESPKARHQIIPTGRAIGRPDEILEKAVGCTLPRRDYATASKAFSRRGPPGSVAQSATSRKSRSSIYSVRGATPIVKRSPWSPRPATRA
jgi:hypothetical protein